MALTRAQIEAKSLLGIKSYRNGLPANDPEIPVIDQWVTFADDKVDYLQSWMAATKSAIGSNPPGSPPPPPGLPLV